MLCQGAQLTESDIWLPQLLTTKHHSNIQLPPEGVNLQQLEVNLIKQALDQSNDNVTKAAKLLGLTRDTLRYRMDKHQF